MQKFSYKSQWRTETEKWNKTKSYAITKVQEYKEGVKRKWIAQIRYLFMITMFVIKNNTETDLQVSKGISKYREN